MKREEERSWSHISIRMHYGYYADPPNAVITCYSDGMLEFKTENEYPHSHFIPAIEDREHGISKKSLVKLDGLIEKICGLERLDVVGCMCDGPSFECLIYLSNGTLRGFHYCSEMLSEEMEKLEAEIRKILREDFFLRKHENRDA